VAVLRKIIILSGLFLFLFSIPGKSASVQVHHRNIDNVRYLIHDDGDRRIPPRELLIFHRTFTQAARHIFCRYNVTMPSSFTVSLSSGAWIFKYLTGFDYETAGLYHSRSRRFYFQNPAALRQKRILERIIYHEMMHCLIHRGRRGREIPQLRWLEECFCEALFPARSLYGTSPAADFREFKNFRSFKDFLRNNLWKKTGPQRRRAYSLAARYGSHLIRRSSERRILGMLLDGRGASILEKVFLQLKRK